MDGTCGISFRVVEGARPHAISAGVHQLRSSTGLADAARHGVDAAELTR